LPSTQGEVDSERVNPDLSSVPEKSVVTNENESNNKDSNLKLARQSSFQKNTIGKKCGKDKIIIQDGTTSQGKIKFS